MYKRQVLSLVAMAPAIMPMLLMMIPAMLAALSVVREKEPVSYTHLRAHETVLDLVCRLLLEKKKPKTTHAHHPSQHHIINDVDSLSTPHLQHPPP